MTHNPNILLEIEDTIAIWAFTQIPTIATCLILTLLTFRITWWARGRYIDYRNRFVMVESDSKRMNRENRSFRKTLQRTNRKLDQLTLYLQATKKIDIDIVNARSPIELTELGNRILIDMGGQKFIDSHLDRLLAKIRKQNFKSALDVQNYCSIVLDDNSWHDDFIPIKDYIYRNPTYKRSDNVAISFDITVAIMIMAIYLRNQFFEKVQTDLEMGT